MPFVFSCSWAGPHWVFSDLTRLSYYRNAYARAVVSLFVGLLHSSLALIMVKPSVVLWYGLSTKLFGSLRSFVLICTLNLVLHVSMVIGFLGGVFFLIVVDGFIEETFEESV